MFECSNNYEVSFYLDFIFLSVNVFLSLAPLIFSTMRATAKGWLAPFVAEMIIQTMIIHPHCIVLYIAIATQQSVSLSVYHNAPFSAV